MAGALPDAGRIYRRGSISERLHRTLVVAALEAAKVGNARPWSSYEALRDIIAHVASPRTRIGCVLQRCKSVLVTSVRTVPRNYGMYSEARCGPLLR